MSERARHRRRPGDRGTRAARLRRADARDDVLDPDEDIYHRGVKPRQATPTDRSGTEMPEPTHHLAKGGAAHRLSPGAPAYTP